MNSKGNPECQHKVHKNIWSTQRLIMDSNAQKIRTNHGTKVTVEKKISANHILFSYCQSVAQVTLSLKMGSFEGIVSNLGKIWTF